MRTLLVLAVGLALTLPCPVRAEEKDEKEPEIITRLKKAKVDGPFTLVVVLKVKEGEEKNLLKLARPCITATRKEKGRIALREKAAADQEGRMFGGLGDGPVPVGLLLPPDGTRAFVACTNADVIVELDLGSLAVRRRLKAGKEPDGLGWSPLNLGQ